MGLKKNICIVASSLGGGGAERVASQQSEMFNNLGFNVYLITVLNSITYNTEGKILNLGLEVGVKDSLWAKIIRHYKTSVFLKANNIDVVIDHRTRATVLGELLYSYFTYKGLSVFYYVHSYKLKNYLPENNFIYRKIFGRGKRIITVAKEIELKVNKVFQLNNVTTIYNPIDFQSLSNSLNEVVKLDFQYVLFYGRLVDEVKNLQLLIKAYQKSILAEKQVKLLVIGDGKDKRMLENLVNKFGLSEMILFKSFISNPFPLVSQAKFTVLTSNHEGFPMTIIESLACGVPVISVDCKSGPKEIIKNKYNGLLVENNNIEELVNAMNLFVLDDKLYDFCKGNTVKSVLKFNINTISKQWIDILK